MAPLTNIADVVRSMVGDWARLSGQCLGVFDIATGTLVHVEGDDDILGPVMGNGDLQAFLGRLHKDDRDRVAQLHLAFLQALDACERSGQVESILLMDHRWLLGDGGIRRVQRNMIPFAWNMHGQVRATLHLLRDISGTRPMADPVCHILRASDTVRAEFEMRVNGSRAGAPSPRAMQIIRLLAQGNSSQCIAEATGLSTHTVNTYRRDLLRRTGQPNSTALVQHATRAGWLSY